MNKTNQYQLNQWDAGDRILREDFNQDNLNVENGLTALKQAISAEASARTTAINNAVSQLNSAKAEKSAVTTLTNTVNALPFVKLKSITVSTAATQVNVDVSDVNLSNYAYWIIVPQLVCDVYMHMRVNSVSSGYYIDSNSGQTALDQIYSPSERTYIIRMMDGNGTQIRTITEECNKNGEYDNAAGRIASVTASTLTKINFVSSNTSNKIAAGGKITIYGVKL